MVSVTVSATVGAFSIAASVSKSFAQLSQSQGFCTQSRLHPVQMIATCTPRLPRCHVVLSFAWPLPKIQNGSEGF